MWNAYERKRVSKVFFLEKAELDLAILILNSSSTICSSRLLPYHNRSLPTHFSDIVQNSMKVFDVGATDGWVPSVVHRVFL